MSEGTEYPKWITYGDGLKVEVKSAADEALWLNPPLPPSPVIEDAVEPAGGTIGSFVKKPKKAGASHA